MSLRNTWPLCGFKRPDRIPKRVVFPEPEAPLIPVIEREFMEISRLLRTLTVPYEKSTLSQHKILFILQHIHWIYFTCPSSRDQGKENAYSQFY